MTHKEQAVQLWAILVLAARSQQILSYTMVQNATRIPRYGQDKALGFLQDYCEKKKLPPLTVLIVREKDGLPSVGFKSASDIFAAQCRVFIFDWLKLKPPTEKDFE